MRVELIDVVANHQFALIKRSGQWKTIESTQHKKIEQALRESEERYSTTLASIGDAVIATDIEGKITFMNGVAEKLTGWKLDDASMLHIKTVFNIINEHTLREVDDPVTKVLENGAIIGLANHTILIRRDGTEIPIDDSGAPIKDRDGNITGVVLVFRDITEHRRVEDELANLASFPKLNPNPVVEVDKDCRVYFLNPAAKRLFPDLQESGGNHPWLANWETAAQNLSENETGMYTRDISVGERWYNQAMYYVPGTQHIRTYGLDITDRKRIEDSLRESEERFRLLVNGVKNYAIFMLDPEGRVITWNEGAERLKGYKTEEIIGQDFSIFYTQEDIAQNKPHKRLDAACSEERVEEEGWRVRKKGSRFWASVVITALRDEHGNMRGFAKVTRDITERKQLERMLIQERDKAKQLLDIAGVIILALDKEEVVTFINEKGSEILACRKRRNCR